MPRTKYGKPIVGLFLAIVMAMGIAGSGVAAQDSTPATGSEFPVNLIFVNAMTSLDAVDVYINGDDKDQRVAEGLEYGTTSAEFEGTAPGTVVVVKQNVSWGVDRYLYNTVIPTQAGDTYVVVISDFVIIPVELDLSTTDSDQARTIGVHAAAQAPAVDIYATPSGQRFAIGNIIPLISDLQYGNTTQGGSTEGGSYDLRLTQTGTDTVALEQNDVAIDGGNSYVIVIIGKPGSAEQPLTLLTVSKPTAN